jgi:hypothetical protein
VHPEKYNNHQYNSIIGKLGLLDLISKQTRSTIIQELLDYLQQMLHPNLHLQNAKRMTLFPPPAVASTASAR